MADLALARLVEHAEAQAYLDLFRAAPADLDFRPYEFDAATVLIAPRLDISLCNRAIGLGVSGPVSEASIQAIATLFRDAEIKNFALQMSPVAMSDAMHEWLAGEQLTVRDCWTKLFRSPETGAPVTTDLRIEQIGVEFAQTFGEVACEGFDMPSWLSPWLEASVGRSGWSHYIAWDGLTPVATSAMFVRGVVAWIGIQATRPDFRRLGAQGSLIARAVADGKHLGCEWFVAETRQDVPSRPDPSYHNMLRAGFSMAYLRPNYMDSRG